MKRKYSILAGILAAGLLFTACGGELKERGQKSGVSGGAVSGGVVSGEAVSGDAVNVEPVPEEHPFSNESNFYREYFSASGSEDEDEYDYPMGFVQYVKNDVSKRKQIKIKGFDQLHYVTDEGVYYTRENTSDGDKWELWRMPIRKSADGDDILEEAGAEKVLTEKVYLLGDGTTYVDSRYIIWMTCESVVRYDRSSKTRTRHQLKEDGEAQIRMINDSELVIAGEDGFYQWNLETDEWNRFWKDPDAVEMPSVSWNNRFFYSYETPEEDAGEEIRMYDLSDRTDQKFFTDKQIFHACEKVIEKEQGKIIDYSVYKLFCQKGKLYVEVQVDWEKNKSDNTYRMNYLIFDVDLTAEPELHLNEEMMKWIDNRSEEDSLEDMKEYDTYIWNAGRCFFMSEGKAIFIMNRKGRENSNMICCYDLSDGSCREVTSDDPDYFLPCYESDGSFKGERSYEDMNFQPLEFSDIYQDFLSD